MTGRVLTSACQTDAFTSAGLVAALEAGWAAMRARHSDVPAVVIVVGSGTGKPRDGIRFGHFEALSWQHGTARVPEVQVSGEGLNRTPVEVFTTLLHEATHAVAFARGVADTSRQGRWHNKKFATLADELGLIASKDDKLGWSPCVLKPTTQALYAGVIADLGAAMRAYRHRPEPVEPKEPKASTTVALECDCPRKLRVPVSVAEVGPIVCGVCESPFLTETQREEDQAVAANVYDPTGQHHGGMPTFPYRLAPDGLLTVRQLRAKGLRPGGQDVAAQILWRKGKRVAYLYRVDLAKPKRDATPAQLKALDKALVARRTCSTCERIRDYYIPRRYGECLDCAGVMPQLEPTAGSVELGRAA